MVDWSDYLSSICEEYACWRDAYTLTDVMGQKRAATEASPPLWDLGLMVQAMQPEKTGTEEQKTEQLDVLEGLRKYAKDHLLLIGKPGSGKSTALVRLLLEEAQKAQQEPQAIIPVLVKLRRYPTSVIDYPVINLIRNVLQRKVRIKSSEIKTLLFEGKLLLLIDGVNELPSGEARRNLKAFEQNHPATPMVFTTREMQGGNLNIAKKLEMQALTETQMREFVKNYLPGKGEQLLGQLGTRLREFGQTPLLLWMLCSVFNKSNSVPQNLGLVFRSFTEHYENEIQQDVPASDESRQWWPRLLRHLGFTMMQGKERTELQVAIPKEEAETTLTRFLQKEGYHQPHNALSWLDDLVKYHLIQIANDQIEFRHQLIQEYYAAEQFLKLKLLSELSDESLKRDYLNYLKWTEPLALMLTLLEDEAQALRVVKLALEVDWQLGARLAGEVQLKFQAQTVELVADLETTQLLKIEFLSITHSDSAVPFLIQALDDQASIVQEIVQERAVEALRKIGSEAAVEGLEKALYHEADNIRWVASIEIGKLVNQPAQKHLLQNAINHPDNIVRYNINNKLREVEDKIADSLNVPIEKNDCDLTIVDLLEAVRDQKLLVRHTASIELREISIIVSYLREIEAEEKVGIRKAIAALKAGGGETIISILYQALKDENADIRCHAAALLLAVDSKAAIDTLHQILEHENISLHTKPVDAIWGINSEAAISVLRLALKHECRGVRMNAVNALGVIDKETVLPLLQQALKDLDFSVKNNAVVALKKIATPAAISILRLALDDKNIIIRLMATETFGVTEEFFTSLHQALEHEDGEVRSFAVRKIEIIRNSQSLTHLLRLLPTTEDRNILNAISAIQERQKYYQEIPQTTANPLPITHISSKPMHILHLSDLHFGTPDQANLWSGQLAEDLRQELGISHLDALILSGDIANKSTPEEYAAAKLFLDEFRKDFPLNPDQIVIVPGNHDLNWTISKKKAYKPILREDYNGHGDENQIIDDGGQYLAVLDEQEYQRRFEYFSDFYQAIKETPYPLKYEQQYTLETIGNLLILGLNSAWQLDHHYKNRVRINNDAFTNALKEISRNEAYKNCPLKMAVWHHPINSSYEDRIKNSDFLGRLPVNGFQLFLHGHVHKADNGSFHYDSVEDGRNLYHICAGTFGAPPKELVTATPWQYNLLKLEGDKIIVKTRKRESENGAWESDARWRRGAGESSVDYYTIKLSLKSEAV